MDKIRHVFILVSLIILPSCSTSKSIDATAIIRVTIGNSRHPASVEMLQSVFSSYDFAVDAAKKLGIAKLWRVPEMQAVIKLTRSISVQTGAKPGLFIVQAHGMDHQLAVKILDELTKHYCSLHTAINDGQQQEVHVSIVQAAK